MKPKVILYTATSLDGRTKGFPIDMGLFYSLAQQWGENASLVGCDTLLNALDEIPDDDKSELAPVTPSDDDPRPILVVPDSRGRLKSWHYWRRQPYWKDFISLSTKNTPSLHLEYLAKSGIKTMEIGTGQVDFGQALEVLNSKLGITLVRVDSGGTLNRVLLRAGLVDELHLLVHPTLVGRASEQMFFNDLNSEDSGLIPLQFINSRLEAQEILMLSYAISK